MEFLPALFAFLFGTILGSFLNVVVYRYNSSASPLKGRSQCFACGKTLSWNELIPVVSFMIQRARCKSCGVKVSWQYPCVEVLMGVVFVLVYAQHGTLLNSLITLGIFSTLIVIAMYDFRHKIIPDVFAALFAFLALIKIYLTFGLAGMFHAPNLWWVSAGPVLFFPFWALWIVSRGRWIGLGDGKLAIGIGWFLGLPEGGSAIILAFWIGAAFALAVIGAQKFPSFSKLLRLNHLPGFSMQSEIPFGPFLILGVFIVYFTHIDFFAGKMILFSLL